MDRYLGVYENRSNQTKKEYPYRVAVKDFKGRRHTPTYTNRGLHPTADIAAWIYNIYALSEFGTRAQLNRAPFTFSTEKYLEYWVKEDPDFELALSKALGILESEEELNWNELDTDSERDTVRTEEED